ncbi:MAG: DUF167 domain-containing protein [Nitrosarchaeum sp.]|nr:DUF167 domain-containing protein [Nitrosarchaeum sp.]
MIYELQVEFHKDFVEINENKIVVGIRSKPIKGEANKEIIKKLAKYFGVSTSLVRIKAGQKSKEKIVEIQD